MRYLKKLSIIAILGLLSTTALSQGQVLANETGYVGVEAFNSSSVSFSRNGTSGTVSGLIEGLSGTTRISARVVLQRQNGNIWTNVRTWNLSSSSRTLSVNESQTVTASGTYRVSVTADITRNGITTTITQ